MTLFLLKFIRKFIMALISSNTPSQLAWGFVIGAYIGLTPSNGVLTSILLLLLLFFNVNFSAGLMASAMASAVAPLLFPLAHTIGVTLLIEQTSLKGMWTFLYNLPILPLIKFNNTVMLGCLIIATIVAPFLFIGCKKLVIVYRERVHPMFKESKFFKALKASKFAGIAHKIWSVGQ